jgi:Ubiquitinol-cytochrome C reductase Fe-S subunit TAT signal
VIFFSDRVSIGPAPLRQPDGILATVEASMSDGDHINRRDFIVTTAGAAGALGGAATLATAQPTSLINSRRPN